MILLLLSTMSIHWPCYCTLYKYDLICARIVTFSKQSTNYGPLSGFSYYNLTILSHQEVPLSVEWPMATGTSTRPFHNHEKKALTVMANNSININKTKESLNIDGQQFHQYQQNKGKFKHWWPTIPPISTKQKKV